MMANKLVPLKKSFLTLISRRAYSALATENVKIPSTATVMKKVLSESGSAGTEAGRAEPKEVFWMKDPKTGYWIPESHFDEVDVVELREKLLSKKY